MKLSRKRLVRGTIVAPILTAAVVLLFADGQAAIITVMVLVGTTSILVALWSVYFMIRRELAAMFSQIQGFQAISSFVGTERPLPILNHWTLAADNMVEVLRAVHDLKPQTIVELGSGSSTVILAMQLARSGVGHLYSLEHDTSWAQRTRETLAMAGLTAVATVLDAPLENVTMPTGGVHRWYSPTAIEAIPNDIDILLIDGPPGSSGKNARYPAFPMLKSRLAERCVVFLDDALRSAEKKSFSKWLQEAPGYDGRILKTAKGLGVMRS